MSGEVGSFKAHFTALIAGAEFMNILKSYIKKNLWLTRFVDAVHITAHSPRYLRVSSSL